MTTRSGPCRSERIEWSRTGDICVPCLEAWPCEHWQKRMKSKDSRTRNAHAEEWRSTG